MKSVLSKMTLIGLTVLSTAFAQNASRLPEAQRIQLQTSAERRANRSANTINWFNLLSAGGYVSYNPASNNGSNSTPSIAQYGGNLQYLHRTTSFPDQRRNDVFIGHFNIGVRSAGSDQGFQRSNFLSGHINADLVWGATEMPPESICGMYGAYSAQMRARIGVARGNTGINGSTGTEVGFLCISHDGRHRFLVAPVLVLEGNSNYTSVTGFTGEQGQLWSGRGGVATGGVFRYVHSQNTAYIEASLLQSFYNLSQVVPSLRGIGASNTRIASVRGALQVFGSFYLAIDLTYLENTADRGRSNDSGNINYSNFEGMLTIGLPLSCSHPRRYDTYPYRSCL